MPTLTTTTSPRASLIVLFLAWRLLLLTIALASPGPGYDTSTQLLFRSRDLQGAELPLQHTYSPVQYLHWSSAWTRLLQALTRWDSIYFASIAERGGYIFEQEWAFGWGFTGFLSFLATHLPITTSKLYNVVIHGVIVANASHLISVLVLYQLALALPVTSKQRGTNFAFVAAALHIVSPAGIFLVAPFTEAPFALLNFTGQLFYVLSWVKTPSRGHGLLQDLYLVFAGISFGLASTVRGNGLLSGIILFYDAALWLGLQVEAYSGIQILNIGILTPAIQAEMRKFKSRRLPATVIAGLLVGIGFATPQAIAYLEYCGSAVVDKRPWCYKIPPSIYTWVQSHYWNVGFLRYWTLSNLPLFLIATPVLYTLFSSSWSVLTGKATTVHKLNDRTRKSGKSNADSSADVVVGAVLVRLALLQFALASAALTSFHVQIISRMSSGYPLWYLILAKDIQEEKRTAQWIVRWMVMYAIIQGTLFVAFLPPA